MDVCCAISHPPPLFIILKLKLHNWSKATELSFWWHWWIFRPMSFKCYCDSPSPPSFPCFSHLAGSEFLLLSRTSAVFGLLQMTAIVFVSFIRFTVSHFPKVPGTHFSITLFLCFRKSIISGDSRNMVPKAKRWHPLSPDLYSYLVLIAFFFIFHFSSTLQLPSSLTGRCIFFLIKLLSNGFSILQKSKALLAPTGFLMLTEHLALTQLIAVVTFDILLFLKLHDPWHP